MIQCFNGESDETKMPLSARVSTPGTSVMEMAVRLVTW